MSQRPLDDIKRATKAANRTPHLRKKNFTNPDMIDVLDETGIGGAYHHDGPYDATLASRNKDKRYAPLEAVKYGNMQALKATPHEYVQDSLQKHVPLQGTAVIPPGHRDFSGHRMDYEEGDDLMRDPDAPGGPYKRWDHIQYHPNDLKGKGEPSYTIEEDRKRQKKMHRHSLNSNGAYEMQPQPHPTTARTTARASSGAKHLYHGVAVRERSASVGSPAGVAGPSTNPKSKRLSDGLKRRFGSLRRRHDDDDDA
ncbi:hypothetical protein F4779DRAFT_497319 [Xylariaceae sp. FL0662B]|nr:hypothetical protein F4779DRAFT_497319 [Xylariaceae sp. FL0662B]